MGKVHAFIAKYTPILKWIPVVNGYLLLYYLFRMVFIKRQMPKFTWVLKAVGLVLLTAILAVIAAYVLAMVLSKETAAQALDYAMPLVGYFVFVPTFIGLCVKADAQE